MRRRILLALEAAERERDPEKLPAWISYSIVGAGPTGAELAGTLGEIANDTLRHDFRNINPSEARIILVEGTDRVLPTYPAKLSEAARKMLVRLSVTVRTGAMVTDISDGSVTIREGECTEKIAPPTILWAAGVLASPLGLILAKEAGAKLDRANRVIVEPDLTIAGHPEIQVIGDLANFSHQTGKPLPGVAQTAMQQGKHAAKNIILQAAGKSPVKFSYKDKVSMATIGRNKAVADIHFAKFGGYLAWLGWLFIHL